MVSFWTYEIVFSNLLSKKIIGNIEFVMLVTRSDNESHKKFM